MRKILTGSKEFFTSHVHDIDYIVFEQQKEFFKYIKSGKECNFCYREGISKDEYFEWYRTANRWGLNFAPLVTKDFLDYMGIDIFTGDYHTVYDFIKRPFLSIYRYLFEASKKYLYRIYIYYRFIQNKSYILSPKELDTALSIKLGYFPNEEILLDLYEFFGQKEYALSLLANGIPKIKESFSSSIRKDWL